MFVAHDRLDDLRSSVNGHLLKETKQKNGLTEGFSLLKGRRIAFASACVRVALFSREVLRHHSFLSRPTRAKPIFKYLHTVAKCAF